MAPVRNAHSPCNQTYHASCVLNFCLLHLCTINCWWCWRRLLRRKSTCLSRCAWPKHFYKDGLLAHSSGICSKALHGSAGLRVRSWASISQILRNLEIAIGHGKDYRSHTDNSTVCWDAPVSTMLARLHGKGIGCPTQTSFMCARQRLRNQACPPSSVSPHWPRGLLWLHEP